MAQRLLIALTLLASLLALIGCQLALAQNGRPPDRDSASVDISQQVAALDALRLGLAAAEENGDGDQGQQEEDGTSENGGQQEEDEQDQNGDQEQSDDGDQNGDGDQQQEDGDGEDGGDDEGIQRRRPFDQEDILDPDLIEPPTVTPTPTSTPDGRPFDPRPPFDPDGIFVDPGGNGTPTTTPEPNGSPTPEPDGSPTVTPTVSPTPTASPTATPTSTPRPDGTPRSTPTSPPGPGDGVQDRDCRDFGSQAEAQAFFESQGGPERDPHNLDADGDGIVCEEPDDTGPSDGGGPPRPARTDSFVLELECALGDEDIDALIDDHLIGEGISRHGGAWVAEGFVSIRIAGVEPMPIATWTIDDDGLLSVFGTAALEYSDWLGYGDPRLRALTGNAPGIESRLCLVTAEPL